MGTLNAKSRKALPSSDFAGPGRSYPIEDKAHARNALARVAQNGSPSEQAAVRRKVHAKYPDLGSYSSRGQQLAKKHGM